MYNVYNQHLLGSCDLKTEFSLTGSSSATWAEEDWEKADEDEADQSESHVKDHHRHRKTSTRENSAQAQFSPASLTTVHSSGSQSLQLETYCASGCVKLNFLCQHLLHLVWLNLNDCERTARIKLEGLFHHRICRHNSHSHHECFCLFSVQLFFSEWIKALFESRAARWAF